MFGLDDLDVFDVLYVLDDLDFLDVLDILDVQFQFQLQFAARPSQRSDSSMCQIPSFLS